jgi:hypothetical protein
MKYILIMLILFTVVVSVNTMAIEFEDIPPLEPTVADPIINAVQPITDVVRPLFLRMSLLVGGLAGLYIILIVIRIWYERKKVKLLEGIKYDLDLQNHHYGIDCSRHKSSLFKRFLDAFSRKPLKEMHKRKRR